MENNRTQFICGRLAKLGSCQLVRCVTTLLGMEPTDYDRYLRVSELLDLQKPISELTCHDEMQFQIVHQVAELWMKLVGVELQHFARQLDADQAAQAVSTLGRVTRIQHLLVDQLGVLDTMPPKEYATLRTGLGRGSGQESPGFRSLLRLPGELIWPAFHGFLQRKNKDLRDIYQAPQRDHCLFQLAEGLVDYDQLLQTWRYRHLLLVYRMIGTETLSLKGKPSEILATGMKQQFFPELWKVRNELFADWTTEMTTKGQEPGYHG